jgi:hypothetical protein
MKWFKKFEDFRKDELEYETPIDETPDVAQIDPETEEEKKKKQDEENSNSYVDEEGVIHISDWGKY